MNLYEISKDTPLKELFSKIGVTVEGSAILQKKVNIHLLHIKNLKSIFF